MNDYLNLIFFHSKISRPFQALWHVRFVRRIFLVRWRRREDFFVRREEKFFGEKIWEEFEEGEKNLLSTILAWYQVFIATVSSALQHAQQLVFIAMTMTLSCTLHLVTLSHMLHLVALACMLCLVTLELCWFICYSMTTTSRSTL
jgi:hypothetical protein